MKFEPDILVLIVVRLIGLVRVVQSILQIVGRVRDYPGLVASIFALFGLRLFCQITFSLDMILLTPTRALGRLIVAISSAVFRLTIF